MKSTELLASFTKPTLTELDADRKALDQAVKLAHTRLPDLLRRINGAALLAFSDKPWRVVVSNAFFAAPWHKAGAHAALDIRLYVENLDSWSELTPFFDLVSLDPDGWSSNDDAASFTRVFSNTVFKRDAVDGEFGVVAVHINAVLRGDTDTCKRVIVGYTPASIFEAQPIYELHCEEPQQ